MNPEFLQSTIILGNTLHDILTAVIVFVVIVIVLRSLVKIFVSRLRVLTQRTRTNADNMIVELIGQISPLSYVALGLFAASHSLVIPSIVEKSVFALAIIAVVSEVIRVLQASILFLVSRFWLKNEGEVEHLKTLLSVVLRIALWSLGLILILSNVGVDVTSLIASLGIGGIAVALAAQNILGDLFGAFAIFSDKPFRIGDFITFGEYSGTVKHIGLKTTRIEALQGEEIVVPNNELTGGRLRNFKRMLKRRVEFRFGVEYSTSPEKLKKILEIVPSLFTSFKSAKFDRVHFKEISNAGLVYEVVYHMDTDDFIQYMDTQQAINFMLLEALQREGVKLAFPTSTVQVVKPV